MYKTTYEQIQHAHENYVHSRMKVLNSGRDFASLKWFGRLVHMIASLKTNVLGPYVLVLHLFSFIKCFHLRSNSFYFFDYSNPIPYFIQLSIIKIWTLCVWISILPFIWTKSQYVFVCVL